VEPTAYATAGADITGAVELQKTAPFQRVTDEAAEARGVDGQPVVAYSRY
jgi:hypothetical protein